MAKVVLLDQLKERDRCLALQEVEVLRRMHHPHVVRHFSSWLHGGKGTEALITVMEYCAGGDLRAWLEVCSRDGEHLPENYVLNLFAQMALGLRYVHSQKILHRDLKTSNMLLDGEHRVVKIGDFGIARVLDSTVAVAITTLGTPYYMSPEVCKGEPYRDKSDMWSLGCVLYELCMFRHAFESQSLLGLVYCIVSERYEPVPADQYSSALAELLACLLAKRDEERPSAFEALTREVLQPYVRSDDRCCGGDLVAVPAAADACLPPPPPPLFELEDPCAPEPPPTPPQLESPRDELTAFEQEPRPSPGGAGLAPPPPPSAPAPPSLPGPPCPSRAGPPPPPPLRSALEAAGQGQMAECHVAQRRGASWAAAAAAAVGAFATAAPWAEAGLEVKIFLLRVRGALLRRPRARGNWVQAFAFHDASGQGHLECSAFEAFFSLTGAWSQPPRDLCSDGVSLWEARGRHLRLLQRGDHTRGASRR